MLPETPPAPGTAEQAAPGADLRPAPVPRARRLAAPLALGALTLGAVAYVGLVDPNSPGHYPLCPTKALTGLDCPGCGGLRAVHSLATGDVVGALDHNAFVVLVLLPVAVGAWVLWLVRAWRGPSPDADPAAQAVASSRRTARVMWVLLGVGLVFTVVRNISAVPAFAWLGSGLS